MGNLERLRREEADRLRRQKEKEELERQRREKERLARLVNLAGAPFPTCPTNPNENCHYKLQGKECKCPNGSIGTRGMGKLGEDSPTTLAPIAQKAGSRAL